MDNGEKLDKILEWLEPFKLDYVLEKERNKVHREDRRLHSGLSWNPKLIISILIGFGAIGTLIGKALGWI